MNNHNKNKRNGNDNRNNKIDNNINDKSKSNEYKYKVLYYKRSNKVHKSRGTSRLDGILTILPPPLSLVTLIHSSTDHDHGDDDDNDDDNDNNTECDDDTSEDDDDDEDKDEFKGMSFKKRMQAIQKKRNNSRKKKKKTPTSASSSSTRRSTSSSSNSSGKVLYSGKNMEISKRVMEQRGLQEDDVITVPQWECEIISSFSSSTTTTTTTTAPIKSNLLQSNRRQSSLLTNTTATSKKRLVTTTAPSLTNKYIGARPITSFNSLSTNNRNKSTTTTTQRKFNSVKQGGKKSNSTFCDVDDEEDRSSNATSCNLGPSSSTSVSSKNLLSSSHTSTSNILQSSSKRRKVLLSKRATTTTNTMTPPFTNTKGTTTIISKYINKNTTTSTKNSTGHNNSGSNNNTKNLSFPGAIEPIHAPNSIKIVLRPHQRDGVTFLWNCLTGNSPKLKSVVEERLQADDALIRERGVDVDSEGDVLLSLEEKRRRMSHGAILADEMGLGKTLMTISIIFAFHRRNRNDRFIIVCPSSLVTNWANEFDKWVGRAMQPKRVVVRKGGEEGIRSIKSFVPVKPNKVEVLIISYELFRINASVISQANNIGLLVVDEGHRLKNTSGSLTLSALNSLHCDARLLITGTPIQNNLSEFHNITNFVCPGILGDLNTFRRVYERPLANANNKNATRTQKDQSKTLSRAFETITSSYMIRRLQKDVLKSLLPPRFEILLFCRPSHSQCIMYKKLSQGLPLDHHHVPSTSSSSSLDALTLLTRLRKLCSHPNLLDEQPLRCSHVTTAPPATNDVVASGKLAVLEDLLISIRSECADDKVVIVSNFTSALSLIENMVLEKRKWSSLRLDGSVEQSSRQNIVDSFNRGSVQNSFVLLLSSKAGGCGLNLIGANRLVMFDCDWNPATDMQAMARVYRQGQTKKCFIYRLFTSGTVEEVIYQRQLQKNNIATLTMDSKDSSKKRKTNHFTKEELRDCFTLKEGCDCDTKQKIGSCWNDYDGIRSLETQDCQDEPLLAMVRDRCEFLSFVHLVSDSSSPSVEIETDEHTASEEDLSSADILYASSSSDEAEFDD